MMGRKLIVVVLAVVFISGGFVFYMFNKTKPALNNEASDIFISSNELFNSFDIDETNALSLFENKIISVKGEVISIKQNDLGNNIILKADMAMAGGINCSMRDTPENVSIGDIITVKGRCQGFLMDVVLNNCSIEK